MTPQDSSPNGLPARGSPATLADVVATEAFRRRPTRPADPGADSKALEALAVAFADAPHTAVQQLLQAVIDLCGAESAGISALEREENREVFRWQGLRSRHSPLLSGSTPREVSASNLVLDGGGTQLLVKPARYFSFMADLHPHVEEILIAPLFEAAGAAGSLWAISVEPGRQFDSEDSRRLETLARVAPAALRASQRSPVEPPVPQLPASSLGASDATRPPQVATAIFFDAQSTIGVADSSLAQLFAAAIGAGATAGQDYLLAIHPTDIPIIRKGIERALRGGGAFDIEYRVVEKEGVIRWMAARGRAEPSGEGGSVKLPAVLVDVTERKQTDALLEGQRRILEMIVQGRPLASILGALCRSVENQGPREACTAVRLLDPSGETLLHGSAPGLPDPLNRAMDGLHVGLGTGTCSAAAQRRRVVITSDIAADPLWAEFREQPLRHGLRASWSLPIISSGGQVLGTIGTFYREIREPTVHEKRVAEVMARTAALAIERKRAEAALSESEERFRNLADNLSQLAWMADEKGGAFWYNERWFEYTGTTLAEVEGWGWKQVHHSDHVERVVTRLQHCLDTGEPWEDTFPLRGKDGKYRWFLSRARPILDASGRIVRWIGTHTDVTEQRKAEEERQKFVSLAEQSSDFIAIASLDGWGEYLNRAGCELVGIPYPEGIRFARFLDLLTPSSRKLLGESIIPRVLATGAWQGEVEFAHLRTGERIPMDQVLFIIRHPETGEPLHLATVARDIREKKRVEQELRLSHRRKDEFLATLAHELRNPLAALRNAVELHRIGKDAKTQGLAQEIIERQIQQLIRLVDDLLDVSRISKGKLELRRERVELRTVIRSAVETSRPVLDAAGHELVVELPEEVVYLDADPTRLAQVFLNLIHNAAKYSERGSRIYLRGSVEQDAVTVVVKDTGVGIPPEMLARIFELFAQVDHSIERSQGGLGIGLTLVKQLVEMHGGSVEARSDGVGRGSEFVVRLPAPQASPMAPEPVAPAARAAPATRVRVLVVDDNRDSAESLSLLLEWRGHDVRTAHDGITALQIAETFLPQAILLDIGLPGLNGYKVAERIRANPRLANIKLVALTGWGQEEDRRRSADAGFDHHLVKPVSPVALAGILGSVVPDVDSDARSASATGPS